MHNYNIVKNVIDAGGYVLTAVLGKIDTFWAEGSLTNDQRQELKELARSGATPQAGVNLFAKLEELEARVKKLEANNEEVTETSVEEYVSGRWYYNGDKCRQNGATYVCTAPAGVACVWSPDDYPAYWKKEE